MTYNWRERCGNKMSVANKPHNESYALILCQSTPAGKSTRQHTPATRPVSVGVTWSNKGMVGLR